ncbi:ATP-binding protein [Fictibacillus sp. Mic-4]|uniref:ATP-binding protein n=1 Tax=Fictibacillus TaxID=1329200 RepID=UPI000687EBC9|nr:ATP-binding protein [Fictibacillus gelatini]
MTIQLIKDTLLQVLMVATPIFVYQHVYTRKTRCIEHTQNRTFSIGILCSLLVILCMSLPIMVKDGFVFDFRMLPVIIGILYGTASSGWLVAAIYFIYRVTLGGHDLAIILSIDLLVILISFRLVNYYHTMRVREKIMIAGFLVIVSSILKTASVTVFQDSFYTILPFFVILFLIQYFTMFFAVYTIESIRNTEIMRERIQQSEKTQVVSELAASVAHEIRNPLTTTRGFIQLISENEYLPANDKEFMNLAMEELDRAGSIINDYLSLARPQEERKEILSLKQQVEKSINILRPFATLHNVNLYLTVVQDVMVEGNPDRFQQALINMIKNGVESIKEKGDVHLTVNKRNSKAVLTICDTGSGMTKEEIYRAGSPFYSTKEKGTGLGLMVTFRIIESMKGRIHIQSELGKGTEFTIIIPEFH